MKRAQYAYVATLALVAACHAKRVQHAAQPVGAEKAPASLQPSAAETQATEPTAVAAPAPVCDLNDEQHLFLDLDGNVPLEASGTLDLVAERVALRARDGIVFETAGDLTLEAEGDVAVQGENVRLNC
jgi:hypothetical protein